MAFLKKYRKFVYFFLLPVFFGWIYIFWAYPNLYTSRAVLLVQPTLGHGALSESASLTSLAPSRSKDAYTLRSVLYSWETFRDVDRAVPLYRYSKNGGFFAGFGGLNTLFRTSDVQLYRFYKNHLKTHISRHSGLLTVRYDAFSPKAAQSILSTALQKAESQLMQSARLRMQARLRASEQGLRIAQDHLQTIDRKIFSLEKEYHLAHPGENYRSNLEVLANLQEQVAKIEAKRSALLLVTPKSPTLSALAGAQAQLEERMEAIRGQSQSEARRAQPIQSWLARQRAAEKALSAAQLGYQKAATEAASEPYDMSALEPVSTPHAPSGPNRWEAFGILSLVCLLFWGFLR